MLEKYDIEVDMAESAERAIEYLNHNRPDAIFMDHLMPGMDGLQAVQAIKGNPQTAMIPIMMYTSQEGELYVGQARALGAMGVLPKQVRAVDVSKVLYELHLLPDRRETTDPELLPVELETSGVVAAKSIGAESTHRLEATLKEQSAEMRRFIIASLDGFAVRISNDVRALAPVVADPMPLAPPPPRPRVWPWVAALLLACAVAAVCAVFWALSREDLIQSRTQLAAATSQNDELRHGRDELLAITTELTSANAANAAALPAAGTLGTRVEQVPYGEIPFDRGRIDALRDYLTKLEAQSFHGVVKITSAEGLFCLSGNATEGFSPTAAASPIGKCDTVGNPFEEALTGQQRQSLAFANLIAGVRQRAAGAIAVTIENAGSSRVAVPYPPRNESVTAGEWNHAAAANNRVEFSAEPGP